MRARRASQRDGFFQLGFEVSIGIGQVKKGQKGFPGRDILLKVRKGGKGLIRAGPQMPD